MDRYDESRNINDTDESSSGHDDGILGLGGSAVPKMPGDPSASSDPASVRRRRERAMEDETLSHEGDGQHSGATGIDMGSGGQGTDISGR
jgi:hypothetical protein